MTRRLYYDDARRLEFSSAVVEIRELDGGRLGVVLEETCFYPTSGGQMHDLGELGGAAVVDVLDEDPQIVHVIEGPAPTVGAVLAGRVDGVRRAHHRQQHTGQHVLSRVLEDEHGWPTLSSRLGETTNTLEISADSLDTDLLARIEDRTNRLIWEGRPVRVHYLDESTAADAGLRRKVDREGPVRVIEVEGHDRCPCGGTHVANTAEIGLVALLGTEKIRGGTRIHFLCGERAVAWRRERVAWLDRTARQLTTGQELVPSTVAALQEEVAARRKRTESLAEALVRLRAAGWRDQAVSVGGVRVVLRALDADEALAAPAALHAVIASPGVFAVLVVAEAGKCQVLAGAHPGTGLDAAAILRDVLARFGGKGGGQPGFARGGCVGAAAESVLEAFATELGSEAEQGG